MQLTRYMPAYGIYDLQRSRISVSRISNFNDPFELQMKHEGSLIRDVIRRQAKNRLKKPSIKDELRAAYSSLPRKTFKKFLRGVVTKSTDHMIASSPELLKSQIDTTWEISDNLHRVLCMTENRENSPSEVPMWAYYASDSRGIRIHFRDDFAKEGWLFKMKYREFPVPLDPNMHEAGEKFEEFVRELYTSKSAVWAHEQEWRLIVGLDDTASEADCNGHSRDYLKIRRNDVVRVDLGIRFPDSGIKEALQLRSVFNDLKIFKAEKPLDRYYPHYRELD
jgi:hypothetical protein